MIDFLQPGWLAVGAAAALAVWWLHRFHHRGSDRIVSAAFLWREHGSPEPRGHRQRPVDRRWRVRALAAFLLASALARPIWPGGGERVVDVWIDDSLSLATIENGSSRAAAATDLLIRRLADADATSVRVRSLTTPGRALELGLGTLPDARAALSEWIRPQARTAQPPLPAEMDPAAEHWLVTDGADASLAAWAASAPLRHIVTIGSETENVAVTRLAVRRLPGAPAMARGLIEAKNTGRAGTRRTVEVHAGEAVVLRTEIDLEPAGTRVLAFEIPTGQAGTIRAALTDTDALGMDDSLVLDADDLQPSAIALIGRCDSHLAAALRAHPGITVVSGAGTPVDLRVHYGDTEPVGVREPVVWFLNASGVVSVPEAVAWSPVAGPLSDLALDPEWIRAADTTISDNGFSPVLTAGGESLIAMRGSPTRVVAVRIDPASSTMATRPQFAALVAGLLDLAAGRPLLDRLAITWRPAELSIIAPRSVEFVQRGRDSNASPAGSPLGPALLIVSLALLLWDTLGRDRRPRGATTVRIGIAALIAIAFWNPSLPFGGRLLDLIVVLDDSRSMDGRGWAEVSAAAQSLPGNARIGLVRYGAEPVVELRPTPIDEPAVQKAFADPDPPRRLHVDGSFTNTESAIRAALRMASPNRRTAVLVVSDGVDTHGSVDQALLAAGRAGIDVYRRLIERAKTEGDCLIDAVEAPSAAQVGQRFRLNVAVTCDRARTGRIVTYLDGRPAGESDITTRANGTAFVAVELASDTPGNREITAVLDVQGDPQSANNTWRSMIAIDGPKPILMVSPGGKTSPLARSFLDGGRTVHLITPERLAGDDGIIGGAGVVVLDDIAIGDAPESAWAALARSVETRGTGLVVLGGPRSFGAGGYRGSRLEALLPVTAESRGPVPRAAVLFLVDKSGSMERDHRGVSRIAHARRAVRVTADSLGSADAAGLMWFDRGPGDAISLRPKTAVLSAFDDIWTVAPSGGTTLVPGFRAALERLSNTDADQRLLVLVTDGITPPGEDLAPLRPALAEAGVSLIALVVGENRQVSGLQYLTAINDGVFLRIDDVARLPSLMRTEVGARRSAWRSGPVVPREIAPLPFLGPVGDWPALGGYAMTTLRPAARDFLQSRDGDPLLAEHHVGLARVVALPGGLGDWARNWMPWQEWGRLVGGLVAWTETAVRSPFADVTATDCPEGIAFRVDAVDASYVWVSEASVTATVADPLGETRVVRLDLTAPGRFEGVAAATQPGRYGWTIRVGNQSISGALIRSGRSERPGTPAATGITESRANAPMPWSPGITFAVVGGDAAATPIRAYLITCALMIFVVLLVHERIGVGAAWSMIRTRIRVWASRSEPRNTNAGMR